LAALLSAFVLGATGLVSAAKAEAITLRIATGQPPGAIHAGRMKNFFEPELRKRVEARTAHTATQA
jgi:C4-dicarboxylate-binding protein DctP